MEAISYLFRTSKVEYLQNNDSDTAVVFIHGIFSDGRKAFKLREEEGYFWDILKDLPVFSTLDFAQFTYGRLDLLYVLKLSSPFNSLKRLSKEIYSYFGGYKSVIFIAHSQGGLLAKTYASVYHQQQGIFLITLHTPHSNESLLVMRFRHKKIWRRRAGYSVPHIFSASINDSYIVKPEDAQNDCLDISYLSKDGTKRQLGHSHLNTNPDPKLLRLMERNIFFFINSGLSRTHYDVTRGIVGQPENVHRIQIVFSRSFKRLEMKEAALKLKARTTINLPWNHKFFSDHKILNKGRIGCPDSLLISILGCSANFFIRSLANRVSPQSLGITIHDLDMLQKGRRQEVNNYLCELSLQSVSNTLNPYSDISFDVRDLDSKVLIDDKEFLDMLISRIRKQRNLTIESSLKPGSDYKFRLNKTYFSAAKKYKEIVINSILTNFPHAIDIGYNSFKFLVERIVFSVTALNGKKNEYTDVYSAIKHTSARYKHNFNIYEIEYLISRLFRSDGYLYWLDGRIYFLFVHIHTRHFYR